MRVCGIAQLVIESPRPPKWHPEREGGGWGGSEGSPHKSWCRSTVIAEILRSPRTRPPLAQDDTNLCLGDFFTTSQGKLNEPAPAFAPAPSVRSARLSSNA